MTTQQIPQIPTPSIEAISYGNETVLTFVIKDVHSSFVNALRRTILSDIPVVGFQVEPHEKNQCKIYKNTSKLHNEILKHRLSLIPVVMDAMTDADAVREFIENMMLEVIVANDTDTNMYITTEHFRIKNKKTGEYLPDIETHAIFPKDPFSGDYILFNRLGGKMGSIQGEELHLTAEFSVQQAKTSAVYNAVSNVSYGNKVDTKKALLVWNEIETNMREGNNGAQKITEKEIQLARLNFDALDRQRHYLPNQFDFIVETVGQYTNIKIMYLACDFMIRKIREFSGGVKGNTVPITSTNSKNTLENAFDVRLENEGYTLGYLLQYMLMELFFQTNGDGSVVPILSFCGFVKDHPHNPDSILRVAFHNPTDATENSVRDVLKHSCEEAIKIFEVIQSYFQ